MRARARETQQALSFFFCSAAVTLFRSLQNGIHVALMIDLQTTKRRQKHILRNRPVHSRT